MLVNKIPAGHCIAPRYTSLDRRRDERNSPPKSPPPFSKAESRFEREQRIKVKIQGFSNFWIFLIFDINDHHRSVPWTRTLLVASERRGKLDKSPSTAQPPHGLHIIVVYVMDEKDVVHGEIQCSVVPGQVG